MFTISQMSVSLHTVICVYRDIFLLYQDKELEKLFPPDQTPRLWTFHYSMVFTKYDEYIERFIKIKVSNTIYYNLFYWILTLSFNCGNKSKFSQYSSLFICYFLLFLGSHRRSIALFKAGKTWNRRISGRKHASQGSRIVNI